MLIKKLQSLVNIAAIFFLISTKAFGQTEVEPWGNITGIRVEGQLMKFESSLQVVSNDWRKSNATALEHQHPKYTRDGSKQIVVTNIDSFYFRQSIEEDIKGSAAKVNVQFAAKTNTDSSRLFFNIKLPNADFAKGIIMLTNLQSNTASKYEISSIDKDLQLNASGIKITGEKESIQVVFDKASQIIIKKGSDKEGGTIQLYIPLQKGNLQDGQSGEVAFTIKASGKVDSGPVSFHINTNNEGRTFTGFGGNFRLQNPKTDPQVIDYCLQNMRVAWGRVEMPFQFWQPVKDSNPIDSAKEGKLHPHVKESMEMAARLYKMGIPVILTAWSAPRWAITGELRWHRLPGDPWGNPLDTANMQSIYKSIADYITFLKDEYGVKVSLFSFNESDLGINIRQTGEEHAQLIKGLGAYFQSRGLETKMLLGDNSDATTYQFIYPAMKDVATHPYIGAISFHSWRGWDTETLQKWADAAAQMKLPLIVGEGSIDAAAWNYPAVFEEQTYAIKEINLYTRLMAICQPLTILQWQLTADYSPLIGGGIFGNNDTLHPGQRFWNLKQLASIPKDLSAMPITVDKPYVSCAAQGNNKKHLYAIHIVNDGASRTATITGLPTAVKSLKMFVTNKELSMKESKVTVVNGIAKCNLLTESYVTLISE
ncbi:MAG: hypothetical protein M3R72_03975 [Bacteroidota bacterium]|nr:hypothetical protein [Bacteroidota bacterium]